MTTIVESIYEHGVLKPFDTTGLKEHQRYRIIIEELPESRPALDPMVATDLARRTTILSDGRRIVRSGGILAQQLPHGPDDSDPIANALDELRREQAAQLEAELDELFPPDPEHHPGTV